MDIVVTAHPSLSLGRDPRTRSVDHTPGTPSPRSKRQPRVAFVTHLCPYYRRPLFELLSRRLDVTFYFFSEGHEAYHGSTIRHDPGRIRVRETRRIAIAGQPLLVGLHRELSAANYDVVVKCINGRLMVPFVYALAKRRKLPFVLWTGIWKHPETPVHRATRPLVEGVYRGADSIVVYGEHVRRFVGDVRGVRDDKVFAAGQAVEMAPYLQVNPSFPVEAEILFVGRLEENKGVRDLLDAFASLDDRGVRLRLAGTGSLESDVRDRAALDPRIEVLGHTDNSDIPRELSRARCLVLPSVTTTREREPWGLVVNEAMAAGVPVITSDAVGAAAGGLVRDGVNGFIVRERAPAELADALRRLTSDRSLARSLGAQARLDVSEFDYDRMAAGFEGAIAHALAGR